MQLQGHSWALWAITFVILALQWNHFHHSWLVCLMKTFARVFEPAEIGGVINLLEVRKYSRES